VSFRIEEKTILNRSDYFHFLKILENNNIKKMFPTRKIQSLYFDNYSNKMFVDSEEGITPRKKIRIRKYNNTKKYCLEIKINSPEGKFKNTKKINDINRYIDNGYFDNLYGLCFPKIWISYIRDYYFFNGSRITIDKEITYEHFNKTFLKKSEKQIILEIKNKNIYKIYDENFNFTRYRFSKYSEGMKKFI